MNQWFYAEFAKISALKAAEIKAHAGEKNKSARLICKPTHPRVDAAPPVPAASYAPLPVIHAVEM